MLVPRMLYRYRAPTIDRLRDEIRTGLIWCSYSESLNDRFDGVAFSDCTSIGKYKLKHKLAVPCFSESNDNPMMWAHYAQNSKGACLGYDRACLVQAITDFNNNSDTEERMDGGLKQEARLGKVKYVDNFREELDSTHSDHHALLKTSHWKKESEWRILHEGLPGTVVGHDHGCNFLASNCLMEIIISEDTDDKIAEMIRDEISGTQVHLKRVSIDYSIPGYSLTDV